MNFLLHLWFLIQKLMNTDMHNQKHLCPCIHVICDSGLIINYASKQHQTYIFASWNLIFKQCARLTLKLGFLLMQRSRCVLAQWPLKSIRFYESSGGGQFTIEAGKVAPMGEGVFVFHTQPGIDSQLYSAVDHFIISTLDRVKVCLF